MSRFLSKQAGDVLEELEQFVTHAAVYWESYWTFIKRESFTSYRSVFEKWDFWYSSSKEASFIAAIASISKFFEKNNCSINIHYFIQLLKAEKDDWGVEIAAIQAILVKCDPAQKDIIILRSNYYVHKRRNLTFEETYAKTVSQYNHIKDLIECMRECIVVISRSVGGSETATQPLSHQMASELEAILKLLKGGLTEGSDSTAHNKENN